jgi:hypothetical protein
VSAGRILSCAIRDGRRNAGFCACIARSRNQRGGSSRQPPRPTGAGPRRRDQALTAQATSGRCTFVPPLRDVARVDGGSAFPGSGSVEQNGVHFTRPSFRPRTRCAHDAVQRRPSSQRRGAISSPCSLPSWRAASFQKRGHPFSVRHVVDAASPSCPLTEFNRPCARAATIPPSAGAATVPERRQRRCWQSGSAPGVLLGIFRSSHPENASPTILMVPRSRRHR